MPKIVKAYRTLMKTSVNWGRYARRSAPLLVLAACTKSPREYQSSPGAGAGGGPLSTGSTTGGPTSAGGAPGATASTDCASCGANATCEGNQCVCKPGFEGNGAHCDDINECAAVVPVCSDHEVCTNKIGGFDCVCENGFDEVKGTCVPQKVDASLKLGGSHGCLIRTDRALWCWGENRDGGLGDGTNVDSSVPLSIGSPFVNAASGVYHTCAIQSGGTLYCWGDNEFGQLGTDTMPNDGYAPAAVVGAASWSQVTAGEFHTCGIQHDGTLWCWGGNDQGQLGNSYSFELPPQHLAVPTASGDWNDWQMVSAGDDFTCGIRAGGSLYCWGSNAKGQLGTNSEFSALSAPQAVGGSWTSVSAGYAHACGIQNDLSLWCWGDNSTGQLGDGTTKARPAPIQTSTAKWKAVATAMDATCAINLEGALYCWGSDQFDQLGTGPGIASVVFPSTRTGLATWTGIAAGDNYFCGLDAQTTPWCWGYNHRGQAGTGSADLTIPEPTPVAFPSF